MTRRAIARGAIGALFAAACNRGHKPAVSVRSMARRGDTHPPLRSLSTLFELAEAARTRGGKHDQGTLAASGFGFAVARQAETRSFIALDVGQTVNRDFETNDMVVLPAHLLTLTGGWLELSWDYESLFTAAVAIVTPEGGHDFAELSVRPSGVGLSVAEFASRESDDTKLAAYGQRVRDALTAALQTVPRTDYCITADYEGQSYSSGVLAGRVELELDPSRPDLPPVPDALPYRNRERWEQACRSARAAGSDPHEHVRLLHQLTVERDLLEHELLAVASEEFDTIAKQHLGGSVDVLERALTEIGNAYGFEAPLDFVTDEIPRLAPRQQTRELWDAVARVRARRWAAHPVTL